MTGFAKRREESARPKLLALYQTWMRAYTVRLHPELEQLWQLSDALADRQP